MSIKNVYEFIKACLLVILLTVSVQEAQALNIYFPQEQNLTVKEEGIFFSGKISKKETVSINGDTIKPAKNGAFSYCVPLKEGENIFAVQTKDWFNNKETIKYTIKRVSPKHDEYYNKFIESEKAYYFTKRDNVVLRSTPVDAGMNRLGYLPKDTKVVVDGIQNEFSRIYLSKNNYAWAFTKDLVKTEGTDEFVYEPKTLNSTEQIKTANDITYVFELSENTPYSAVVDDNKLVITIYNLDNLSEDYTKEITLGKFPRYSVCMKNGVLYATVKKLPFDEANYSNKKVKIVIDPGHGGKEFGAIGCLGHKEKVLNLDVGLKLKKILEQHGFNVVMTRETDEFVSLNDRVKYAQDYDALIFVSIHLNSVPISDNPNLNEGSITFYFNPQGKNLAQEINKMLSHDLHTVDCGVSQASWAVVRPTEYIGVLTELAYLVNPKDVNIYRQKKFPQTAAEAIYKGLVNYIHSEL